MHGGRVIHPLSLAATPKERGCLFKCPLTISYAVDSAAAHRFNKQCSKNETLVNFTSDLVSLHEERFTNAGRRAMKNIDALELPAEAARLD